VRSFITASPMEVIVRAPNAIAVWSQWRVTLLKDSDHHDEGASDVLWLCTWLFYIGTHVAMVGIALIACAVCMEYPNSSSLQAAGRPVSMDSSSQTSRSLDRIPSEGTESMPSLDLVLGGDSDCDEESWDSASETYEVASLPAPVPLRLRRPLRRRASSQYDGKLYLAFQEADADQSGDLSKRQLYSALERLGLRLTSAEKLGTWSLFDCNANGRVDWDEFRQLGSALLEQARDERQPHGRHSLYRERGGFAHRPLAQEQCWARTSSRIHSLARRRSLDRIRTAVLRARR